MVYRKRDRARAARPKQWRIVPWQIRIFVILHVPYSCGVYYRLSSAFTRPLRAWYNGPFSGVEIGKYGYNACRRGRCPSRSCEPLHVYDSQFPPLIAAVQAHCRQRVHVSTEHDSRSILHVWPNDNDYSYGNSGGVRDDSALSNRRIPVVDAESAGKLVGVVAPLTSTHASDAYEQHRVVSPTPLQAS